jgi:alkanesulfonate monooxygenase SsuD/methylene tetrahydromethanopterin reductase-like flavin-dependent oxidoreductase (luciferase family)
MAEAKQRFEETWRILERAMKGGTFTFEGKNLNVDRQIEIRPRPRTELINFYGAIGNPASATKIADLGMAPISNGTLAFDVQRDVLKTWNERAQGKVRPDVAKPVAVVLMMADTDAEADALARKLLPHWFEVQVKHYAFDAARHHDLPDYRPFAETHQRRINFSNPANLDPLLDVSLIGSPQTIRRRLEEYIDIGFNSFILHTGTPGVPTKLRAEWLTRFAREIAPEYAPGFGRRNAQAAE